MPCPTCQTPHTPEASYCDFCGADLSQANAPKRRTVAETEENASPAAPAGGMPHKRRTVVEAGAAPGPGAFAAPPGRAAASSATGAFADSLRAGQVSAGVVHPPGFNPFGSSSARVAAPGEKRRTVYESEAAPQPGPPGSAAAAVDRAVIGVAISFSHDPHGTVFVLREGKNTIGRDEDRDIVLPDGRVSGKHACIQFRQNRTWVFDDNSNNGTFLNGKDIFEEKPALSDGDEIRIGGTALVIKLVGVSPTKRP